MWRWTSDPPARGSKPPCGEKRSIQGRQRLAEGQPLAGRIGTLVAAGAARCRGRLEGELGVVPHARIAGFRPPGRIVSAGPSSAAGIKQWVPSPRRTSERPESSAQTAVSQTLCGRLQVSFRSSAGGSCSRALRKSITVTGFAADQHSSGSSISVTSAGAFLSRRVGAAHGRVRSSIELLKQADCPRRAEVARC